MLKIYIFIATVLITGIASELTDFLDIQYSAKEDGVVRKMKLTCTQKKNVNGKCENDQYTLIKTEDGKTDSVPFKPNINMNKKGTLFFEVNNDALILKAGLLKKYVGKLEFYQDHLTVTSVKGHTLLCNKRDFTVTLNKVE